MPNEVDVELFRSLCLYNIYLMQLHGSGLLERLKILLSLYKSPSILAVRHTQPGAAALTLSGGPGDKVPQEGPVLFLKITSS